MFTYPPPEKIYHSKPRVWVWQNKPHWLGSTRTIWEYQTTISNKFKKIKIRSKWEWRKEITKKKKFWKKNFFQEINSGAGNGSVGKNICPTNLRATLWSLLWKEAHLKTLFWPLHASLQSHTFTHKILQKSRNFERWTDTLKFIH